ncbi:MAG: FAD-dependent oxidoreductase, partial [Clostridiales bacterium]|nr:FAD-dependent oxidoreductase [Clostridiales bacterium]
GGIARNEENGKLLLHYSDYISAGNISESGEKLIEYRNEGCNGDHAKSQIESRNKYLNEGRMSAEYDLIVLSTGLKPSSGSSKLFQDAGIKTDQFGFCWTNEMNPPQTSVKGILACGASAGPKDIPETVLEASAAAAEASAVASATITDISLYKRFFKEEAEPETRDVSKEPVRVGVFVCHCGINIGGYLSVSQVVEHAKKLPHVVFAEEYLYSCSIDSQKVIADRIKEYGINRVVVASCTPRTHEPLFQGVLQKAGLNPYLFTMANIRDQCSWVHMDQYKEATEKAKDLLKMAVGKAIYSRQLTRQKIEVNKSTLVIGGGMAGMSAALELAGMGFFVYLAEKSNTLGGNARQLSTSVSGRPIKPYVEDYIHRVENNPLIKVLLNARIERIDGYVGNFSTILRSINNEFEPVIISHGAVIVATGAHEQKPSDYLYGKNPAVLTQLELEDRLEKRMSSSDPNSKEFPDSIFMIQCASSRNSDTPYCSRVCCNQAVKNALRIRQKQPDTKITILYRDIRTYGMNELQYKRARKSGIRFVHYETANAPFISENDDGSLAVSFFDGVVNKRISENAGMLVLAGAVKPDADENRKLGQMLKVPVNQDGFFLEAHVKLRPVDFATEGVFLCGLAHSPRNLRESITQGKAAAARAATIVSKDMLETEGTVARTDDTYCSGCGACEMVCAYKAITIEDIKKRDGTIRKARINAVLCKGCGTCSAVCRCGAIDVNGFSDRQVLNEIDFLMQQ